MSFIDVRLPKQHGYGTVGGPSFATEIVVTANRREKRNQVFVDARRRYDLAVTARTQDQAEELTEFHAAMRGAFHSFRFWDALDYKLTDQLIGTGDGTETEFQIVKTYAKGTASHTRTITKPVAGLVVEVNDVVRTITTDYTIDLSTGVITFVSAPASGHAITVSGEFDVPVRFVEDELRWTVVDSVGDPPDQYLWRPESMNLIEVIGE